MRVDAEGVAAFTATHFNEGGAGATDLAKGVLALLEEETPPLSRPTRPLTGSR